MPTMFRTPYIVIERKPGKWQDGHYYPEMTGPGKNVMMTIRPPGTSDQTNLIAMTPAGGRVARYIKVYTETKLGSMSQEPGGAPGDFILYDGKRFLIIGENIFGTMKKINSGSRVSHYRYYAAELIEDEVEVSAYDAP